MLEILSNLAAKRVPSTGKELELLILEIAYKEIVQSPSYIKEAWKSIFERHTLFRSNIELCNVYEKTVPTARKIKKMLHAEPTNDRESESCKYLQEFVRNLQKADIATFLRYATGADMICVEKINVMFTKPERNVDRVVVAHTCGPTLEMPTTYESFQHFQEEFLTTLQSGYWSMDFA